MNFEKINAQMEEYVRSNEMAGGALIVRKSGEILLKSKWGYANIEARTPVEYDSVFRMASSTKPPTAVGILRLIERGKASLDDEVKKYIPEFCDMRVLADERYKIDINNYNPIEIARKIVTFDESEVKTVPADRDITIRDLLTHSSGLGMEIAGLGQQGKMNYLEDTLETRARKYAKFILDFQPGTATGYSGLASMDIIARIIEVISGKPFDEYMRDEIFTPLGMTDTTYRPTDEQKKRLVKLYKTDNGEHIDVTGTAEDIDFIGAIGPNYTSGSAGLYSTVEDYDRFAAMLANGGEFNGVRILKPETVRMIYTEGAYKKLEMAPGMEWGLGMIVRKDPEKAGINVTKNTYGWSGAYGTHFFVSPEQKLAVIFVMNRSNIGGAGSYISKRLEELVFEK